MLKPQGRELPRLLFQRFEGRVDHNSIATLQTGALKGAGIESCHLAPDHAPTKEVGLLTHGMTTHIVS